MTRLTERFGAELPLTTLFEAPTIGLLAEAVQAAAGQETGSHLPPIVPAPRDADLPLSFSQERLWFLDRLIPENPVYHVPLTTRLRGKLQWAVLAESLNEVVRRHEALRTTFACVDDLPVQVIAPSLRLDPPVIDLGGLPAETRESEAWRLIETETARPFDLARGPLARALLVRLEAEHHLALFNLHHIVADGWSLGVLMQELGTLYAAFAAGRPSPLPPLPVQYADYAVWQRQWLQGERLEEQVAFWRERLAGAPAALDLPFDRPRPAIQRFQGAKIPFWFETGALAGLTGVQRASQVTTFMVLLAAYQTLMSRLSGQEDLVVGSPVAGRSRRETEGLIGFFVNTLVFRGDLSGDPTFRELLGRVRQVTLEAYAREDLPFERLVEQLQPERSLAHSPIFQVALVLLNTPPSTLDLPGLTLETIDTWVSGTKWDMAVSMEERAEGLAGYWEYDSDLFDAATVHRFVGQLRELLTGGVAAPERRLSEISWLTEPERHQLLQEWNAGTNRCDPTPAETTLHGRFDAGVQRWPEADAVVWDDGRLTYRELAERAGRLAHHLRTMGVGPEVPVALCLDRGPEIAVSILAVLEAGGAYVPIDPHYPRERQEWVLEDSGAKVLLTTQALAGGEGPQSLLLLDTLDLASGEMLPPGASGTGPDHLAYIMYTSGSTGRPKGVMVTHRDLVRLFTATDPWFGFGPGDTFALFHSYAFDVSVWELWGALLHGARAAVVPHWVSRSPEDFHALLRKHRVTALNQTPQAFRQLATADADHPPLADLRTVILAGEALELPSLTGWWERYGADRPRLINMHGITETTVYDTWRPVSPEDLSRPGTIGQAVPDLVLRVLDRAQQPVAIGVPGELCIGGPGLARGYLRRPDLTAERFVPDQFGARLYRTGDLVRYRADGDMEFLGRIDHQVKIRGIRIELGEIEAVLVGHSGVEQAVVVAMQEPGGDRRLVAWVVASGVDPAELREHCRRLLPEPMVPSIFAMVDALPLTPAGKVDRRALTSRSVERPASTTSYKPPGDELERQVAEIWQEVLGLERVGVEDNFFDLGGHSLALVQVQRKIRNRLSREVSVVDLFRTPTIAALARSLSVETDAGAEAAQQGDERAQRRRALRERRRSAVESPDEVYEHVE
jgi:amino acid adenylation domain-containing protein